MSAPPRLEVFGLLGLPEIAPGDDLAGLLADTALDQGLSEGDCLVVTQKIVSKAEGRVVNIDPADPAAREALIRSESVRILRRRDDLFITETRHGFVCANAGVDFSNMPDGTAALLPLDPDRSARRIRDVIRARGVTIAVVITDTFGRPWRQGVADVAIGVAGIHPVVDLRGTADATGRTLMATEVAVVDEIAAAAELVMGKADGIPAAVVRGLPRSWFSDGSSRDLVRPPADDLFR